MGSEMCIRDSINMNRRKETNFMQVNLKDFDDDDSSSSYGSSGKFLLLLIAILYQNLKEKLNRLLLRKFKFILLSISYCI